MRQMSGKTFRNAKHSKNNALHLFEIIFCFVIFSRVVLMI